MSDWAAIVADHDQEHAAATAALAARGLEGSFALFVSDGRGVKVFAAGGGGQGSDALAFLEAVVAVALDLAARAGMRLVELPEGAGPEIDELETRWTDGGTDG